MDCRRRQRSLAALRPEILLYWDYERNTLDPYTIMKSVRHVKLWLTCPVCGHRDKVSAHSCFYRPFYCDHFVSRTVSEKRQSDCRNKALEDIDQSDNLSKNCREDSVILQLPIKYLSPAEFQRLFSLYFSSQGYKTIYSGECKDNEEVDLVLLDQTTSERIMVRIKQTKRLIGPEIVRELNCARFNVSPPCSQSHLITSGDIASRTLEQSKRFGMKLWYGIILETQLEKWPEWQGKTWGEG